MTTASYGAASMGFEIFVPLIGQYENIGDIILRRPLADWLRPLGRLHVFLGHAPSGYERALRLAAEDHVYRSFAVWYKAGLRAAVDRRAHYVFKPGEIQLTVAGMKEHVGMLPLLALIRSRGGRVLRVGSGTRNFARVPRLLLKPSLALSDLCVWRDDRTAQFLGAGQTMPDLAFWEGDPISDFASVNARPIMVVSLRGDRPAPDAAWICKLRAVAQNHRMQLVVPTQVLADDQRSRELAEGLACQAMCWVGKDHDQHERQLRDLYRRTRVVISDRLHVLIAACTHGAIPIGICSDHEDKIRRHFAAAGVPLVVSSVAEFEEAELERSFYQAEDHAAALRTALTQARGQLDSIRSRISDLLGTVREASTAAVR